MKGDLSMKLLIVSDLHLDEDSDMNFVEDILDKMLECILSKKKKNDKIIVICLGDMVNNGGTIAKFKIVENFISRLLTKLKGMQPKMLFVPGNHELEPDGSLSIFNDFVINNSFLSEEGYSEENGYVIHEEEGFIFYLVDSTRTGDYDASGKVYIQALKETFESNKRNMVFLHHPPSGFAGGDAGEKCIEDGNDFGKLPKNFMFYGHVHGSVEIKDYIENGCFIHQVGALLKNEVNSEFCLLDIAKGEVQYAYRYVRTATDFESNLIFPPKTNCSSDEIKGLLNTPDVFTGYVAPFFQKKENLQKKILTQYTMEELLNECEQFLIIENDAGMGKTVGLKVMYHYLKEDRNFFPIYCRLRNATLNLLETILKLAQNHQINKKVPFLLFDGLDEIDYNTTEQLRKMISSTMENEKELKILISTRPNYNKTFESFEIYVLKPFNLKQTRELAKNYGIQESEKFFHKIKFDNHDSLLTIPFYLELMLEKYSKSGMILKENDIIDYGIKRRFQENREISTGYTDTLLARENEVMEALHILAFLMHSTGKKSLENAIFTDLFDINIRNLMIKSSIILLNQTNDQQCWEFEHNVYFEYLTACVLSACTHDVIISYVTVSALNKIRPSCLNVVKFLVQSKENPELIKWILQNQPEYLHIFDVEEVGKQERISIFKKMLLRKEFSVEFLDSSRQFAKYYSCKENLRYLVDNSENSSINSENIMHIFLHTDEFFGYDEKILEAMLKVIPEKETDQTATLAVEVLYHVLKCNYFIYFKKVLVKLDSYKTSAISSISFRILVKTDTVDENIDFVIKKIKHLNFEYSEFSIEEDVTTLISKIDEAKNLLKLYQALTEIKNQYQCYLSLIYEQVFSSFQKLQKDFVVNIKDELLEEFKKATKEKGLDIITSFKEILDKNGLEQEAFSATFCCLKSDIGLLGKVGVMYKKECQAKEIIGFFRENPIQKNVLRDYQLNFSKESNIFQEIENILSIEGKDLGEYITDDVHKMKLQYFFDQLFDKNEVEKMLDLHKKITPEDIKNGKYTDAPDVDTIMYFSGWLYSAFPNESPSTTVIDEDARYCQITNLLQHKEFLQVTTNQKQTLRSYCESLLKKILELSNKQDIDKKEVKNFFFLMDEFHFEIPDKNLLELLFVPQGVIARPTEVFGFLSRHLYDKELLIRQIKKNLRENIISMSNDMKFSYLKYCYENNVADAVPLATEQFTVGQKENSNSWREALNYLLNEKGYTYVERHLVDDICDDVIEELLMFRRFPWDNLVKIIEKRCTDEEDALAYFTRLCWLGSTSGFEAYLNQLASNLSYCPPQNTFVSIKLALSSIQKMEFLPFLIRITPILCWDGNHETNEEEGLKWAFRNLILVDAEKILCALKELKENGKDNNALFKIVSELIMEAEEQELNQKDVPWGIQEAISFLEKKFDTKRTPWIR